MENLNQNINLNDTPKKKPTTLVVLAVLTIINSGFMFLGYISIGSMSSILPQIVEMMEGMNLPEQSLQYYEAMIGIPGWKFIAAALCYAMSVCGAIFMLKLNVIGFHLYTISQILLFVVSNFLLKGAFVMNLTDIIFAILFILMYAIFIKMMRNPFAKEQEQE